MTAEAIDACSSHANMPTSAMIVTEGTLSLNAERSTPTLPKGIIADDELNTVLSTNLIT